MRPATAAAITPRQHRVQMPQTTLHIAEGTLAEEVVSSTTSTTSEPNLHLADFTPEETTTSETLIDPKTATAFTTNLLQELNTELGLLKGSFIDTYSLGLSDDGKTLTLKGRASTNHFKGQAMTYLYNRLIYGETRSKFSDLVKNISKLELNFTVGFYPSPLLVENI